MTQTMLKDDDLSCVGLNGRPHPCAAGKRPSSFGFSLLAVQRDEAYGIPVARRKYRAVVRFI